MAPREFLSSREQGPIAFAHRGGARLWPENTLLAFEKAIEAGCRFIETDVHMTRDGTIVVHHDPSVERTTDGRGHVRNMSLAELRRLDAGHWFTRDGVDYPYRHRSLRVPTLEEAVSLDPEVRFNVDIKQRTPPMVEALWRFIDQRGLHERFLIASEDHATLQAFRALARGTVATSASRREVLTFLGAARARLERTLPVAFEALQVPWRAMGMTVVDPRFVQAAHRRGVQVHVWTVDERADMRRLLDLEIDGIMSDRPDVLLDELR